LAKLPRLKARKQKKSCLKPGLRWLEVKVVTGYTEKRIEE